MLKRFFGTAETSSSSSSSSGKGRGKVDDTVATVEKLKDTLNMLEKREGLLEKKKAAELENAKKFTKEKNKRAAMQCLKMKKMYEAQIETLSNQKLRVMEQVMLVEGAKSNVETVNAMKQSAQHLKDMSKKTNIDNVDKTMDDIDEVSENFRQVQDRLAQPVGMSADIDEDELDAELEELEAEELDKEVLEQTMTMPAAPAHIPAIQQPQALSMSAQAPAAKVSANSSEEDELAKLQAEMEMLEA